MPLYHTKQEVFDLILEGVRKQGGLSVNGTMCAYRSNEGKRCAIGLLIPDDRYVPDMEGSTYSTMWGSYYHKEGNTCDEEFVNARNYRIIRSLFGDGISDEFLCKMQKAHDHAASGKNGERDQSMKWFEMSMETYARQFSLTYTPPSTT